MILSVSITTSHPVTELDSNELFDIRDQLDELVNDFEDMAVEKYNQERLIEMCNTSCWSYKA